MWLESERKEENAQYVGQWSKEQHINSLSNKGYGRETLRLIKLIAFEKLSAHRLWLDVRLKNIKAQNVYKCEGFNKE